jgi:hypothetical protein
MCHGIPNDNDALKILPILLVEVAKGEAAPEEGLCPLISVMIRKPINIGPPPQHDIPSDRMRFELHSWMHLAAWVDRPRE